MACNFTPKGSNDKLNENQMKAYLIDGGLKDFINSGDVKVREIADYFKAEQAAKIEEGRAKGDERVKGIVGRLAESEDLPEPLRKRIEALGLKYNARNQAEADLIAKEIIAQYGEELALEEARKMTFGGDVSSAVFANALNSRKAQEDRLREGGDPTAAFEMADSWAELAKEYDEFAREQGRFTSYIQRFYEQSGIGLAMKMAKQKAAQFNANVVSPQQKTFDDLLKDIQQAPEFEAYVNEKVKEALAKRPNTPKATKKQQFIKKVTDLFDSMKVKSDVTYATIIPPSVLNAALELIKQALILGANITDAIAKGVKHISDNVGTFDNVRFENEMREQLSELVNQVEEAEWKKLATRLLPKSGSASPTIRTDIGKINGYLSRRNDAERGVMLAALISKMNDMGVISDAQLSAGYPSDEELEGVITNMTDDQKAEVVKFLSDRIGTQKSERAREAALRMMKASVRKQIADLEAQITKGERKEKDDKPKLTDAELDNLRAVRAELSQRLDDLVGKPERPEKTFEQKVKQATKALEKQIAEYQRLIDAREFKQAKKDESVDTPELKALREQLQALKDEYAKVQESIISTIRPDQAPDWYKENIIKKYMKRLKKMTDEQKQDFMRKMLVSVVANGGLNQEEFQKLLGDVLGYAEPSAEEMKAIEALAQRINQVEVERAKLNEANRAYEVSPTPENKEALGNAWESYLEKEKDAENAKFQLNEKLYRKANAVYTFMSLMQLNTLGLTSLVMNASYNLFQMPLKIVDDVLRTALEHTLSLLGSGKYKPTFSLLYGDGKWLGGAKQGLGEGAITVMTGQQKMDYYQQQMYQTRIRPVDATKAIASYVRDKVRMVKGLEPLDVVNANMTANELADKIMQASPAGYHAEAVARGLSLFDKPFRYSAESAKAAMLAKSEFGITDTVEKEIFMKMPYEEARRRYYDKFLFEGKTPDEARDMADEQAKAIEAQITLAGDKGIFTQSNFLADKIEQFMRSFRGSDANAASSVGQILFKANFLFVRIPMNVAWSVINYSIPAIALAQTLYHVGKLKFDKDMSATERAIHEEDAKKWFTHAVIGASVVLPIVAMILPAVTGGDDDDDTAKERKATQAYVPPRSLNISMLNRILGGEANRTHKPTDTYVKLQWFGTIGAVLGIRKLVEDKETKAEGKAGLFDMANSLSTHALYGLSSGGFENFFSGVEALKSGGSATDKLGMYGLNMYNVLLNTMQPATYAAYSRATMDYNYSIADDTFADRMRNNIMARSVISRWARYNEPPAQVTIWGDTATRTKDGFADDMLWMFGVNQGVKNNFAPELYAIYEQTKDSRVLPPFVQKSFTVDGIKVELNYDQWRDLQKEVGSQRKELVNALFGDAIGGVSRADFLAAPATAKLDVLDKLYSAGAKAGKAQYITNHRDELIKYMEEKKLTEEQLNRAFEEMTKPYWGEIKAEK